jgi:hypothetical protein
MTLRLRLTLLYGAVFVAAGAGLLAVTYGLFKHSQNSPVEISARSHTVQLPARLRMALTAHPAGKQAPAASQVVPPKAGKSPPGLIRQIEDVTNGRLAKVTSLANVALHRQRSNDASSLLEWSAIALAVVALLSIGLA